jgi:hypothetical protein
MENLTHYYKKGDPPFRTLSTLTDKEAVTIARGFQDETAVVYRRFKEPEAYWKMRRRTEAWVRSEFVEKGGRPTIEHPQYMVLGRSHFIHEGYDFNCDLITIPISEFEEHEISFTYPDSMVSLMLVEERQREPYFQPEYHGKVFTLGEIREVVDRFGVPEREWDEEPTRKYDFFVEAQIWSERVIGGYR